jgi:hypothetical protein
MNTEQSSGNLDAWWEKMQREMLTEATQNAQTILTLLDAAQRKQKVQEFFEERVTNLSTGGPETQLTAEIEIAGLIAALHNLGETELAAKYSQQFDRFTQKQVAQQASDEVEKAANRGDFPIYYQGQSGQSSSKKGS